MAKPLSGISRFFCAILMGAIVVAGIATPAYAATKKRQAASTPNNKYAAIVIDADTGAVLSESSADKALYPASLVKTMTLLMAFEELDRGTLSLNDQIMISRHAASMVPSKLNLPAGSTIRVEDAIYALVTKSANDIAVAMAEKIGGTESNFAVMMNRKAQHLGMTRTRFVNASGLHHPQQVSSARDMSKLARYVILAHSEYYHYFSTRQFSFRGNVYRNHNHLMNTYEGMDGFKTGYIQPSGFNLIASAKRNERRLIGVVFGGRSASSRNAQMASLLDRGFGRIFGDSLLVASNDSRKNSKTPPVPSHKPAEVVRLAAGLNGISTAAGTDRETRAEVLSGQGDSDPAAAKRYETGLMAIASVRGKGREVQREVLAPATRRNKNSMVEDAAYTPQANPATSWSVQIGAFGSRVQTDRALRKAVDRLPKDLAAATPAIAPLKTRDGWVFRARLTGLSRQDAVRACSFLSDCLPVAPQSR